MFYLPFQIIIIVQNTHLGTLMYVRKNYSNTLKFSVLFNLFLEISLQLCGHKNNQPKPPP